MDHVWRAVAENRNGSKKKKFSGTRMLFFRLYIHTSLTDLIYFNVNTHCVLSHSLSYSTAQAQAAECIERIKRYFTCLLCTTTVSSKLEISGLYAKFDMTFLCTFPVFLFLLVWLTSTSPHHTAQPYSISFPRSTAFRDGILAQPHYRPINR